jgi:ferric-dicitrate binding protein FerR (iron transport regulator)
MQERSRPEQVLHALVEDARRESAPDLDWESIESSLLSRARDAEDVPRRVVARPSVSRSPWFAGVAAMATAVAAVVVGAHVFQSPPQQTSATAPAARTAPSEVDGDALAVGSQILATVRPVTVTHRGHAAWTLDAQSSAHLEGVGEVIAIALDEGSLSARVVKSERPESFVVRVERTRVAVHGTAFRVERRETTARISVSEGVVGVGPLKGTTFELPAPSSAVVDFEGARTDLVASGSGPNEPPGITPPPPAPHDRARSVPPEKGGPADGSVAIGRIEEGVRRCFADLTVSRGDLKVTVSTRMSLQVNENGHLVEASFDPPLVPAVRSCVDAASRNVEFPRSTAGLHVDRVLELEH